MNKQKPRLGRGLSSLIPTEQMDEMLSNDTPADVLPPTSELSLPADDQAGAKTDADPTSFASAPHDLNKSENSPSTRPPYSLPLDRITPNPAQPRRQFDETSLQELAASLKTTGLIQPVIVRSYEGAYQLVAGERRWRAAKLAGLSEIPAIIRDVDGFTQAQMALVENIQREDLNPLDRATAYRTLMDQLGLTQAEVAGRLGEDRSTIANFLRLLELAEPVRLLVQEGKLSMGHAKILAGLSDPNHQLAVAQRVVSESLSVRNLERLIQQPGPAKPPTPPQTASPHLDDLQKTLRRQLGMRVEVKEGKKKAKGKLVIHYANLDEFDQLLDRLGIKLEQ